MSASRENESIVEKPKRTKADIIESISNLNKQLADKLGYVKHVEEILYQWIDGRRQNLEKLRRSYNSATSDVFSSYQRLLALKEEEKRSKRHAENATNYYVNVLSRIGLANCEANQQKTKIERLIKKMTQDESIQNNNQETNIIEENSKNDISDEPSTSSYTAGSLLKDKSTIATSRERLCETLQVFKESRNEMQHKEMEMMGKLNELKISSMKKLDSWKTMKNGIVEELQDIIDTKILLTVQGRQLENITNMINNKTVTATSALCKLLESIFRELEKASRSVNDRLDELYQKELATRKMGEPTAKDIEMLNKYFIIPDYSEYHFDANANHEPQEQAVTDEKISFPMPMTIPLSPSKQNKMQHTKRVHALIEKLPELIIDACKTSGTLAKLKGYYQALTLTTTHQSSILLLCCDELDGTGLADAFWNRSSPPVSIEGDKSYLIAPLKVIGVSDITDQNVLAINQFIELNKSDRLINEEILSNKKYLVEIVEDCNQIQSVMDSMQLNDDDDIINIFDTTIKVNGSFSDIPGTKGDHLPKPLKNQDKLPSVDLSATALSNFIRNTFVENGLAALVQGETDEFSDKNNNDLIALSNATVSLSRISGLGRSNFFSEQISPLGDCSESW